MITFKLSKVKRNFAGTVPGDSVTCLAAISRISWKVLERARPSCKKNTSKYMPYDKYSKGIGYCKIKRDKIDINYKVTSLIPVRSGKVKDVVIDTAGVLI